MRHSHLIQLCSAVILVQVLILFCRLFILLAISVRILLHLIMFDLFNLHGHYSVDFGQFDFYHFFGIDLIDFGHLNLFKLVPWLSRFFDHWSVALFWLTILSFGFDFVLTIHCGICLSICFHFCLYLMLSVLIFVAIMTSFIRSDLFCYDVDELV